MNKLILTNAVIVGPNNHFEGSLVIEDGRISEILPEKTFIDAIDLKGAWLLPGCIDIHTDQLEHEIAPRPKAIFPIDVALHNLDIRAIAAGLTTIFSCIRFSMDPEKVEKNGGNAIVKCREIQNLNATTLAKHFVQARWDTNFTETSDMIEEMKSLESLQLIVYNENIPGKRQFRDMDALIHQFSVRKKVSIEEAKQKIEEKIEKNSLINNRPFIRDTFGGKITIGSHDDTTIEHVLEAKEFGATLSEMPTTLEAALKARELGMWICMGASNYFRGGSSYDNLSCEIALEYNCVDIMCSDYHFPTLLNSFLKMVKSGISPSRASSMISLNPAKCVNIDSDYGSIEIGKVADLVSLGNQKEFGVVKSVWVDGRNVYTWGADHYTNSEKSLYEKVTA